MGCKIVVFTDIVREDNVDSLCDSIGLNDNRRKTPFQCEDCGDTVDEPTEVLGTSNKPLFWECESCEERYPIYSKIETERQLSKALGCWTTPDFWVVPERKDFN